MYEPPTVQKKKSTVLTIVIFKKKSMVLTIVCSKKKIDGADYCN